MNAPEHVAEATQFIPLDVIGESPTNPRTDFPADKMAELTASIKRLGVLQPVLMRPWPESYSQFEGKRPLYELVAGARRYRAATAAGLTTIEAKIRSLTDHEVVEIQMIENLQREDLHPMDEAYGYEQMIEQYGYTVDKLVETINKSRAYIYARLKLTALCHDARKAFRAGQLNPSTALLVARVPVEKLQVQALREITDTAYGREPMSVRRAQEHLQTKYMLRLVEAPFSRKDMDLVKAAGSCEACPKRTGNQPGELFEDVKSADVCTDPDCYAKKKAAHVAKAAAEAKKAGQEVITGKAAKDLAPQGTQHLYSDKIVKLDDRCYEDPKNRTYRQLLGKEAPAPKLLEDVRSGHMIEVVEKKQLAEAMKKAGIEKPKSAQNTAHDKKEKAAELEKKVRQALLANVRNELVSRMRNDGAGLTLDEARLVTAKAFTRLWDDYRKRVAKLWLPDMKVSDAVDALRDRIATMPPEDLCLLQMDMSLVGEVDCHYYDYEKPPTPLIDAAKRLGLDPVEIRKDVLREAGQKATPPTKAARAAKPNARAKTKEAPAAEATPEALAIGDRIRIKEGLKGPSGHLRKCCGREGTVEAIAGDAIAVRFGKKSHEVVADLKPADVEKLPPATLAAQAAEPVVAKPLAPVKPWPFPTASRPVTKPEIEKNENPAADAAKDDIEKNEGRASAACATEPAVQE